MITQRTCLYSLVVTICLLLTSTHAQAVTVTVEFSGMVDTCFANCLGLPVTDEDPFSGSFSYDTDTGEGLTFSAEFPEITLTSTEFILQAGASTPYRFNLNGRMFVNNGGYFMNINLVDVGNDEPRDTVPTSLSCADWDVCSFVLWAYEGAPGEPPFDFAIAAVNLDNTSPERFSLTTQTDAAPVPEPSTFLLVGVGLWFLAWRHHHK